MGKDKENTNSNIEGLPHLRNQPVKEEVYLWEPNVWIACQHHSH